MSSFASSHTSCPCTSHSIDHDNDIPVQVSVSSPQYSIDTTSLHNSNDEIHQNVSLVVRYYTIFLLNRTVVRLSLQTITTKIHFTEIILISATN